MKLRIWQRKYSLKKPSALLAEKNITMLSFRKLKRNLKPLKDNNFYNFLRFTTKYSNGKNSAEEDVYEVVSSNNPYLEMTSTRKICEKSLIAILQTVKEEQETSLKYESMEVGDFTEPTVTEEDNIYECFDN